MSIFSFNSSLQPFRFLSFAAKKEKKKHCLPLPGRYGSSTVGGAALKLRHRTCCFPQPAVSAGGGGRVFCGRSKREQREGKSAHLQAIEDDGSGEVAVMEGAGMAGKGN